MATEYCLAFDLPADRIPLPGSDLLLLVGIPLCSGLLLWWFHRGGSEDAQKGRGLGMAGILIAAVVFVLGMTPRVHEYVSVRSAMSAGRVKSLSGIVKDYRAQERGYAFFVEEEFFGSSHYSGSIGLREPRGSIREGLPVRVGFVELGRENVIVRLEVEATAGRCDLR